MMNPATQLVCLLTLTVLIGGPATFLCGQDTTNFSGPQVGEDLPRFSVRGVLGADAGKDLDFISEAQANPVVLIFVHATNRQSIGLTRILSTYTKSRLADGLHTGIVFLDDDPTNAENAIKRMQHALTPNVPVAISPEGKDGPGSYGLNRNVTLTILVGKEQKVTANYALVQPSIQSDLPKILESIVAVVGGEVPKLEDLEGIPAPMRTEAGANSPPNLRPLVSPLIKRDATDEEVDNAAKAIQERCESDPATRKEMARISKTIVDSGKLENYGTPRAQDYLKKWSVEFAAKDDRSPSGQSEPMQTEKTDRIERPGEKKENVNAGEKGDIKGPGQ